MLKSLKFLVQSPNKDEVIRMERIVRKNICVSIHKIGLWHLASGQEHIKFR